MRKELDNPSRDEEMDDHEAVAVYFLIKVIATEKGEGVFLDDGSR